LREAVTETSTPKMEAPMRPDAIGPKRTMCNLHFAPRPSRAILFVGMMFILKALHL
jgi:hypothetical protein